MNIHDALEKISPSLPADLVKKASDQLSNDPSRVEIGVPNFALYYVKDPKNLEFILKGRLRAASDTKVRQVVEQKHTLLNKAIEDGNCDALWAGYFIQNGKHISLLLNLKTGEVINSCYD